jgi:hypothetical protein
VAFPDAGGSALISRNRCRSTGTSHEILDGTPEGFAGRKAIDQDFLDHHEGEKEGPLRTRRCRPFKLFCGAVVNVNDPGHVGAGQG